MTPRDFAVSVVLKLRESSFEAYWAGGCVRDELRGTTPHDYDVATNATPAQIKDVFHGRRTIDIGASFGVVTIIGPRSAGQIEIATFRQDGTYSDGRRPDRVQFSSAIEDAQRRDFTINGMFFDPIDDQVIDFVGGQADLQAGIVRCIGEAEARIDEDKLRMLRAVRFAARFGFQISNETLNAIQKHAAEIQAVSAERIANEMKRVLIHSNRRGLQLLQLTKLRKWILTEFNSQPEEKWLESLELCDKIASSRFELNVAGLLWPISEASGNLALALSQRWKLSNNERDLIVNLIENENLFEESGRLPWPRIQRKLIQPFAPLAAVFARSLCEFYNRPTDGVEFCESKLRMAGDELNPKPLITGNELKQLGMSTGSHFRTILDAIRDLQLEGTISTTDEAMQIAEKLYRKHQA